MKLHDQQRVNVWSTWTSREYTLDRHPPVIPGESFGVSLEPLYQPFASGDGALAVHSYLKRSDWMFFVLHGTGKFSY